MNILKMFVPSENALEYLGSLTSIPADIPMKYGFVLAIVFTVWRYVFQFLGAKFFVRIIDPAKDREQRAYKASESAFKFFYYLFSWLWAVVIIVDLGIWTDTLKCIQDWPYKESYSINAYILWELAFYVSALGCHFTIETRRKDFVEMLVHHVVTIFLIVSCIVFRLQRIGVLVLAVHDVADIVLEAGKMANYVNSSAGGSVVFFGLLLVVWVISRLYYFPVKVIRAVYFEHYLMFNSPYCQYFTGVLCILLVLHLYWTKLIIKTFYKYLTTGKTKDAREDFEHDEGSGGGEMKRREYEGLPYCSDRIVCMI